MRACEAIYSQLVLGALFVQTDVRPSRAVRTLAVLELLPSFLGPIAAQSSRRMTRRYLTVQEKFFRRQGFFKSSFEEWNESPRLSFCKQKASSNLSFASLIKVSDSDTQTLNTATLSEDRDLK